MLSQFNSLIGLMSVFDLQMGSHSVGAVMLQRESIRFFFFFFSRNWEINELARERKFITWIRLGGFASKSHQHHLCVVPTPHLSNLCDTWLGSIDMREICQPPCLFTACADSLAACLFVYSLSRSKQMPSLFFSAFPLFHQASESKALNSDGPCCTDLFRQIYMFCKLMS